MKTNYRCSQFAIALLVAVSLTTRALADEPKAGTPQQRFASPEDAVKALLAATKAGDKPALHEIFGPDHDQLLTGDAVQDAAAFDRFSKAVAQMCQLTRDGDDKVVLNIGAENWPFPIPLVRQNSQWFFDTAAGKEEIINRHVGRDELNAITVCRAYVGAQRQYASQDRDGNGVLKYAQQLKSAPGKKDGLYWESAANEELSPFGPLVSRARAEGYAPRKENEPRRPYYGYFFKVLTRQGAAAPGGKYDYVINGNMIAGFALVAYPAEWGKSGIMTFIVSQQGKVYQRNFGPETAEHAAAMTEYNPDPNWSLVSDQPASSL